MKPRLFVASSVEGLDVAYAVQENLEHHMEITVWSQGVFNLTKWALDSLIEASGKFDAAVFVFSADDVAIVRGAAKPAIRDNVVFELGLFIGTLGRDKCFILKPNSVSNFDFPSDLFGVVPASFDDRRADGNLLAALGPSCNKIKRALVPIKAPQPSKHPHPDNLEAILIAQPYRLVFNPGNSKSKRMLFRPGGVIEEGNNRNEHSWRIVNGKLELLQLDGSVHSRFTYDRTDGVFRRTKDPDNHSQREQFMVPDEDG